MENQDHIYSKPLTNIAGFTFDENVAQVFPDMIKRSAPGYELIIEMICMLTRRFSQPNSNLYDLGCSLGASTLAMRHGIDKPGCKIIGVDNSGPMLDKCRINMDSDKSNTPVELVCADIQNIEFTQVSVVTLNFTLQFVPPDERLNLLQKIFHGMLPGGALVLSEKITFPNRDKQELITDLHHEFKRFQGYSDLEISQKRTSLENVLIPETEQAHLTRLTRAGFAKCAMWFQCFSFSSFIAVK